MRHHINRGIFGWKILRLSNTKAIESLGYTQFANYKSVACSISLWDVSDGPSHKLRWWCSQVSLLDLGIVACLVNATFEKRSRLEVGPLLTFFPKLRSSLLLY